MSDPGWRDRSDRDYGRPTGQTVGATGGGLAPGGASTVGRWIAMLFLFLAGAGAGYAAHELVSVRQSAGIDEGEQKEAEFKQRTPQSVLRDIKTRLSDLQKRAPRAVDADASQRFQEDVESLLEDLRPLHRALDGLEREFSDAEQRALGLLQANRRASARSRQ